MRINMKNLVISFSLALALLGFQSLSAADNSDRLILVSGATGTQGGAVVRALLEKGFAVRAMTRNPGSERAIRLAGSGVEIVQADFDDMDSLDRALDSAYGAFSVQPWRSSGTDAEIRQGNAFADAALRAGIQHFVYTSNAAAAENTGIPHFDSKYAIEEHIRSIEIPYTIIGPRSFMSNVRRDFTEAIQDGILEGAMAPEFIIQYIAPQDIGRFAALAFENPDQWIGENIGIAGDEITYLGLAELLSEITGRTITYVQTPRNEIVERATPEMMKGLEWNRTTTFSVDVDALREEYPWMMSLEEYLLEQDWLTR